MKILMLSPSLSTSAFITTYPYAKILSKKHEVKIVGPLFGKDKPYIVDKDLDIEVIEPPIKNPIQLAMLSLYPKNLKRLLKDDYDVLHTFKLLPHTAPVAARSKKTTHKPFILTVDDYDVASPQNPIKKKVLSWAEKSYKSADAITVSSTFLQKVYGGEVIYQVANEFAFLNKKHNGKKIRKKYNLEDKTIILHAGSFYDQKGIDILIKAVKSLNRKDVVLLLVGNGRSDYYKRLAGDETIFTGHIPLEKIPDFVDACNIYAIPTKSTLYTRAEIPAKIFEAMMLKKPVVATNLSDIPLILNNGKCGILAKPDSVSSFANSLEKVIDDEKLRKRLGRKAKERYMENYSYKQIEKKITKVYSDVME